MEKFNRRDLDEDLNGWSVVGTCHRDEDDNPTSVNAALVLLTCGTKERVNVSAELWQEPEERERQLARVRDAAEALTELADWMEERVEAMGPVPEGGPGQNMAAIPEV